MTKLDFFKKMYDLVKNPNPECLKLSLADTHHKGIFSLVIDGTEFGKLTRVFIADKKLKPFEVQLHTHRYPVFITVIKGDVKQFVALPTKHEHVCNVELSEFEYKSPLNGGGGLSYVQESIFNIIECSMPIGSVVGMSENNFHTMSCSKGSIWIVEEQGFRTDSSKVLGVPFITDGLYNKPEMFQVNDKCQIVAKELKKIILDYEVVS